MIKGVSVPFRFLSFCKYKISFSNLVMFLLLVFVLVISFFLLNKMNQITQESIAHSRYVLDVVSDANVRVRVFSEQTMRYDAYVKVAENLLMDAYIKYKVPYSKRMTPAEISQFLNLIYTYAESGLYDGTDVWLALAYAEHESHFVSSAVGSHKDRGLFQFIPSTSNLLLASLHEPYTEGMEFNIGTSVRLWFVYYSSIYRELTAIREFENKEQEIKFISIKYNSGKDYFTRFKNSSSVDEFISRARSYDYAYHKKIYALYQRNYENDFIFR